MQFTVEQVLQLAPDEGSAAAGRKLAALKNWEQAGHSPDALWGVCRGSGVYQVKVDLSTFGYNCSCPSRKFPCKHVLGLLIVYAAMPDAVTQAAAPDWVAQWLERRRQKEDAKAERLTEPAAAKRPVDIKAQQRRARERQARVSDGLTRLDLWLRDLVRNGLGAAETQPPSFWDDQAKRLVDAQASGLAARVARLGNLPRSSPDWPARLLAELGRLRLLIHAWTRIDELDAALQSDVRQLLGWTINQDELLRDGQQVDDVWAVIGQWVDDEDRIRALRSWVVGRETQRTALVLQFAMTGQPFAEPIVPGTEQQGTLVFYPGAAPQRAKYLTRIGNVSPIGARLPGSATLDGYLATVAQQVAIQPWLSSFAAVLHDVRLVVHDDTWFVCDGNGQSIALAGRSHWALLAVTGGHPFDLTGEWDGYRLRPLGFWLEGTFRLA